MVGNVIDEVDEYQVPYYNMVPHDPSFEEMRWSVWMDRGHLFHYVGQTVK